MSQYNKLSDIRYARFRILPVDLHFETVLVSWYLHHVHDQCTTPVIHVWCVGVLHCITHDHNVCPLESENELSILKEGN